MHQESKILFCHETLHVSGIYCAHHQELSAVHLATGMFHAGLVAAAATFLMHLVGYLYEDLGICYHVCCKIHLMKAKTPETCSTWRMTQRSKSFRHSENKYKHIQLSQMDSWVTKMADSQGTHSRSTTHTRRRSSIQQKSGSCCWYPSAGNTKVSMTLRWFLHEGWHDVALRCCCHLLTDKHKPPCMPSSNQAHTIHLCFPNTYPSLALQFLPLFLRITFCMTSFLTCSSLIDLYLPLGFCTFSFVLKVFFEILYLSSLNSILFTSVLLQLFIFKSCYSLSPEGRTVTQAVSHWPPTVDPQVQVQASPQGIHAGQSDTQRGFSPTISVFLC